MSEEPTTTRHTDTTSTRVIGRRELTVDGAPFSWWAVGERPTLVTVRSVVFGSSSEFTEDEPSKCAQVLARRILTQHYDRADRLRQARETQGRLEPDRKPKAGCGRGPYGLRITGD